MTDVVAEELPSKLQAFIEAVEMKIAMHQQSAVQSAHPATSPSPKPKTPISQVCEQCVGQLSSEERAQLHQILESAQISGLTYWRRDRTPIPPE
jgi:hypothetical protein